MINVVLSQNELDSLRAIYDTAIPVCSTCNKPLTFEEFVESYPSADSLVCDSCYEAYVEKALYNK
jgi:hypothetical protein